MKLADCRPGLKVQYTGTLFKDLHHDIGVIRAVRVWPYPVQVTYHGIILDCTPDELEPAPGQKRGLLDRFFDYLAK